MGTWEFAQIIYKFENSRMEAKGKLKFDMFNYDIWDVREIQNRFPFYQSMFLLFDQKASMGSTDATSIISRDIILELYRMINFDKDNQSLVWFVRRYIENNNLPNCIEEFGERYNWGSEIL